MARSPQSKFISERRRLQAEGHLRKTPAFTDEDLSAFRPKTPLARAVTIALKLSRKAGSDFKILDAGCRRGLAVAYWLSQGFDAYGGEASDAQVALARKGLSHAGRYPSDDGMFDFVYSDNVIEHVAQLDAFVAEVARLSNCGGEGFHIFPSKWKWTEVHLRVPFIQWLPKNKSRYYLMRLALRTGLDPCWVRNQGTTDHEAAEDYVCYLNGQTYYRPPWRVLRAFAREKIEVDYRMTGETAIAKLPLDPGRCPELLVSLAARLSSLFHTTILTTKRIC